MLPSLHMLHWYLSGFFPFPFCTQVSDPCCMNNVTMTFIGQKANWTDCYRILLFYLPESQFGVEVKASA